MEVTHAAVARLLGRALPRHTPPDPAPAGWSQLASRWEAGADARGLLPGWDPDGASAPRRQLAPRQAGCPCRKGTAARASVHDSLCLLLQRLASDRHSGISQPAGPAASRQRAAVERRSGHWGFAARALKPLGGGAYSRPDCRGVGPVMAATSRGSPRAGRDPAAVFQALKRHGSSSLRRTIQGDRARRSGLPELGLIQRDGDWYAGRSAASRIHLCALRDRPLQGETLSSSNWPSPRRQG